MPSNRNWHHGGMAISAKGDLAVACYYGTEVRTLKGEPTVGVAAGKPYQPNIYPGRAVGSEWKDRRKHSCPRSDFSLVVS